MNITCPKCHFFKSVDPARLPDGPVRVNCPKCGDSFIFDKTLQPGDAAEELSLSSVPESSPPQEPNPPAETADHGRRIICSACGTVQAPAAQCVLCGATIIATARPVENQSYAGFWIRVVAYLIDFLLIGVMQFMLGMLFGRPLTCLEWPARAILPSIWSSGCSAPPSASAMLSSLPATAGRRPAKWRCASRSCAPMAVRLVTAARPCERFSGNLYPPFCLASAT